MKIFICVTRILCKNHGPDGTWSGFPMGIFVVITATAAPLFSVIVHSHRYIREYKVAYKPSALYSLHTLWLLSVGSTLDTGESTYMQSNTTNINFEEINKENNFLSKQTGLISQLVSCQTRLYLFPICCISHCYMLESCLCNRTAFKLITTYLLFCLL